ncbi:hypothetical protein GCM10022223_41650 [Kineosporia mesophila]|uniref:NB-ARC domain-containing protein n=1 Tax=Kineosporia mesophila TaxID=566012 RepID=A0ABP6ZYP6_9ACTN|nr:tetratricopeptide repeat protein [Kineosporia mesophila]MCD5348780.1 NB-ARC domain-containing protein [Kineosporia mesophila]
MPEDDAVSNVLTGSTANNVVQVGSAQTVNLTMLREVPPAPPAPYPVPPAPRFFINRTAALGWLNERLETGPADPSESGPRLIVCRGRRGIGKSALVLRAVDRTRAEFPGGHLFAELGPQQHRGGLPMSDVLGRLLRQLGVDDATIPASTPERADRLRSLLAHRGRVLILLDDVREAQQVRWVLPNTSDCVVLATTDVSMGELVMDGAEFLTVDALDETAGADLLRRIAGPDRFTDAPAVARLVELCEGIPLALGAAAARLAEDPSLSVPAFVAELSDERARLTGLSVDGVPVVGAVFTAAYDDLPDTARTVYRALGLLPVAGEFDTGLLAVAAGLNPGNTRAAVETLRVRRLVEAVPQRPGRYRVHGLVRSHAWHLHGSTSPDDVARAIAGYQLAATARADRLLFPSRLRFTPESAQEFPARGEVTTAPFNASTALDWLDRECTGLVATIRSLADQNRSELDDLAWMTAESLTALFLNRRYLAAWYETGTLGARAAERAGRPDAAARLWSLTSRAMTDLGRHDEAELATARAITLASGSVHLQASVWEFRGRVLERTDPGAAVAAYEHSRDLNRQIGEQRGEALALFFLGRCLSFAGDQERAGAVLTQALESFATAVKGGPDVRMQARARAALGTVFRRQGDVDSAAGALSTALAELDAAQVWSYQVSILDELAELESERSHPELATAYRERAVRVRALLEGSH